MKGDMLALPFYKRAAELDPDFAMPYAASRTLTLAILKLF